MNGIWQNITIYHFVSLHVWSKYQTNAPIALLIFFSIYKSEENKNLLIWLTYLGVKNINISYPLWTILQQQYLAVINWAGGLYGRILTEVMIDRIQCGLYTQLQGCALTAPGRLRRLTFGLWRLKKKSGRPSGRLDSGFCENPKRNQRTYWNGPNETKRNFLVLPRSR